MSYGYPPGYVAPGMMAPGMVAPGMMAPGMVVQPGMPVAMAGGGGGGYPAGYPIFTGALTPDMYYKPIWTPKREMKLQAIWYQITCDGVITFREIMRVLHHFGYRVSEYEAQWFYL